MASDFWGVNVLNVSQDDGNLSLDEFLKGIEHEATEIKDKFVKRAGKELKSEVKKQLKHISHGEEPKHGVRLADDVKITTTREICGGSVKIRGGKRTGTLWHIVNDGTYRSRATHFMDAAILNLENKLDGIIDDILTEKS